MSDEPAETAGDKSGLAAEIGAQAARKIKARQSDQGVWFGLGMMGLVGWSVVVPTLIGTAVGFWVDHRHSSARSWTLALMIAGLSVGCLNAWYWVAQQTKAMRDEPREENE